MREDNLNIYKPPNSDLIDKTDNFIIKRSLWLLIPCHVYFWLKLLDYIGLYFYALEHDELFFLLELSVNIPVYIGVFCYLFLIKLRPRLFWKIWIIVAISDEIRVMFLGMENWNVEYFINALPVQVIPLYILGFVYAYRSNYIWSSEKSWGLVNRNKSPGTYEP